MGKYGVKVGLKVQNFLFLPTFTPTFALTFPTGTPTSTPTSTPTFLGSPEPYFRCILILGVFGAVVAQELHKTG